MTCSVADFRCTYVSELIGSEVLAFLILGALYFGLTSYLKIGFRTSIWLSIVIFPILAYYIIGTTFVFALMTLLVSFLLAFLHTRIIGNR